VLDTVAMSIYMEADMEETVMEETVMEVSVRVGLDLLSHA